MAASGRTSPSLTQLREQFLNQILTILGDTRVLFMPKATDTTTSLDESLTGRTLTHNATLAGSGRLSAQGLGQVLSYASASGQYTTSPDTANLSFGNGTNDSACSFVFAGSVVDTAATRAIITKAGTNDGTGTGAEYEFIVDSSDKLMLRLTDNSVVVNAERTSDAAITMGSFGLYVATYAGTGGATAANGVTLYQNGILIASTAANNASYVAMEDKTCELAFGATYTHGSNRFNGSLGLGAICQKALSASEVWALHRACKGYFNY
jgi:hypothetical protein